MEGTSHGALSKKEGGGGGERRSCFQPRISRFGVCYSTRGCKSGEGSVDTHGGRFCGGGTQSRTPSSNHPLIAFTGLWETAAHAHPSNPLIRERTPVAPFDRLPPLLPLVLALYYFLGGIGGERSKLMKLGGEKSKTMKLERCEIDVGEIRGERSKSMELGVKGNADFDFGFLWNSGAP